MADLKKLIKTNKVSAKRKKLPPGKYVFKVKAASIKPKDDDENVIVAKITATTKDGTLVSETYYLGYFDDDGNFFASDRYDEFKMTMYAILGLEEPNDLDAELGPDLVGKFFIADVVYNKGKKDPDKKFFHFVETSVVEAYGFDDPGDE